MSELQTEPRFAFGANWRQFLEHIDEGRIRDAEASLRRMLGVDDLSDRSFLDVGCGSGLFSLAAARLGAAPVQSIDYDPECVAVATELKRRFLPDARWEIERGDATDADSLGRLGTYDVVYSWGVLHHTGAMWRALDNTCARVAPGGLLFIAIYNDQGRMSRVWRRVKVLYNELPPAAQTPYAVAVMLPLELKMLVGATVRHEPSAYFRSWTDARERGMSHWHDLIDWVGGYPFEVATPEEVFHFCRERGFELQELSTCRGELGNNEFVFRRTGNGAVHDASSSS